MGLVFVCVTFIWGPFAIGLLKYFPVLEFLPLFLAGIVFYEIRLGKHKNYLWVVFCFLAQFILRYDMTKIGFEFRTKSNMTEIEYGLIVGLIFILFTFFTKNRLQFLKNRALNFIGKISYPLYLIHFYFVIRFAKEFFVEDLGMNFFVGLIGCYILSLLAASIVYYVVEKPINDLVRKKLFNMTGQF